MDSQTLNLLSRIQVVFSILKRIGPLTYTRDVGPKILVVNSHTTREGVTLKGKFWYYYPSQDFKATPTFRLVLEVEVHPEATPESLGAACMLLKNYQAWVPQFTADETQQIATLIFSGHLAEYLGG
jgi:hypothetical protein